MGAAFRIARNPDPDSKLPFLLWLPLEGGVVLKTRETWPRSARLYCHPAEEWPDDAELIEEVAVQVCRRRGSAIDLVLDRRQNSRSQFVETQSRGRDIILWQTARVVKQARPGVRLPRRRAAGLEDWVITVDTREKYPYRFVDRSVTTQRAALRVGDYGVVAGDRLIAAVERKTLDGFTGSLSDGSLGFAMAELAGLEAAAVVVEDRYSALFKVVHVQPGWLPEVVASLQVRYPAVPIVFLENRKIAEEWTYRFLGAATREFGTGSGPTGEA